MAAALLSLDPPHPTPPVAARPLGANVARQFPAKFSEKEADSADWFPSDQQSFTFHPVVT